MPKLLPSDSIARLALRFKQQVVNQYLQLYASRKSLSVYFHPKNLDQHMFIILPIVTFRILGQLRAISYVFSDILPIRRKCPMNVQRCAHWELNEAQSSSLQRFDWSGVQVE